MDILQPVEWNYTLIDHVKCLALARVTICTLYAHQALI